MVEQSVHGACLQASERRARAERRGIEGTAQHGTRPEVCPDRARDAQPRRPALQRHGARSAVQVRRGAVGGAAVGGARGGDACAEGLDGGGEGGLEHTPLLEPESRRKVEHVDMDMGRTHGASANRGRAEDRHTWGVSAERESGRERRAETCSAEQCEGVLSARAFAPVACAPN
jgi:hypothetical protein